MEQDKLIETTVRITEDYYLVIELPESGDSKQVGGAIFLGEKGAKKLRDEAHMALEVNAIKNGDLPAIVVAAGPTIAAETAGGLKFIVPLTPDAADRIGAQLMAEADKARNGGPDRSGRLGGRFWGEGLIHSLRPTPSDRSTSRSLAVSVGARAGERDGSPVRA